MFLKQFRISSVFKLFHKFTALISFQFRLDREGIRFWGSAVRRVSLCSSDPTVLNHVLLFTSSKPWIILYVCSVSNVDIDSFVLQGFKSQFFKFIFIISTTVKVKRKDEDDIHSSVFLTHIAYTLYRVTH